MSSSCEVAASFSHVTSKLLVNVLNNAPSSSKVTNLTVNGGWSCLVSHIPTTACIVEHFLTVRKVTVIEM